MGKQEIKDEDFYVNVLMRVGRALAAGDLSHRASMGEEGAVKVRDTLMARARGLAEERERLSTS